MAENDSQHLTEGQIFVLAETGGDPASLSHIDSCATCRSRLNDWRQARSLIASAGSRPPAEACPPAEDLANYAAGALPADRSDAILAHLVDCADCSAILADNIVADPAPRREPIPLRPSVAPRGRRSAPYWRFAVAAALLLALGGSFMLWWSERGSKQPAALLAEVYTQVRPFDYRLPDAGYGPIRLQRGAQSAFAVPEALPSAVAAIRRMLDTHPQSAGALALKGRAELLQNNFESAIESLSRATAEAPHDMDALADLAAAYAVRGEFENRNADYGHAMELLLRALRQRPDDPRILFNLALTYQKLWMVDEAIDAWRRFLRGNPPAGWRREAEEQLAAEEKIKAAKKQTGEIFTDPKRFLVAYGSGESFDPLPWYDIFWTEWLPRVSSDPAAARSARLLATAFTRYGEFSLTDTLNAPAAAAPDSGIALLARTIVLNRSGHPGEALANARHAAARLDSMGLHAAAGLARAELVYAARWVDAYRECRQTSGLLLASPGKRYPWITATAMLNYSACLLRQGDDGRARSQIETAQARLAGAALWPLTLRATQFAAGADSEIGNFGSVWETAPEGLHRYWTTAASDYRAEGFHDFLRIAAAGMGWRECAVVLYRAAIRFSHAAGNPEMEAANRSELAKLLQQMGDYPGEVRELAEMNRLLDSLGQQHDAGILRWEAALLRIQADLATGAARDPLPELGRLAADAAGAGAIQQSSLAQTEGLAYQARGDSSHAAVAFARAIDLAEQRAASLNSWVLRIPVIESAGPSYRNLTLIQLMRQHDPASAFATWSRFRLGAEGARRCIAIAPLPEGIAIWTVIDGDVSVRWVDGNTDDLQRSAEEFLSLCASPASGGADIHRVGNRLYGALLRPELQRLGPGTILLLAKSWLEKIPFGALTGDQGEYLARRYHFVQAYGPPRSTPAGAITSGAAALIVAAPAGIAPGQPPLPVLTAAEREAADVAAHFPPANVSRDATLDWLSEKAPKAEVFHFCGHGWANGGNGALILPPGPNREPRFVTAANLAAQNWSRCRLAVLSACLTAAGETRGAVNNQSLVQALLSAGSRRVVAARWSVDSEATRVLMDAFYARLASGKSVPEALYGAEAEVAESPGWSRPYYWAAFDLFGSA